MDSVDRRTLLTAGGSAALGLALASRGELASAAPAAGPIRLSLNENAWGPSPKVAEAIRAELGRTHRYVEQDDADVLRHQIAVLEKVSPEQVILGEVLEPLGLYLGAQQRQGGEVVYSTPGYTALTDAAAPLGVVGRGVPLNAKLENDLPALLAAIGPKTLALSLVNPHNPSGTVNDGAVFDRFIEEASAATLVIVDEAYLEYDPQFAARSAIRHVRSGRNVLLFRTLAKIYGLAGLSIGYAVAPAPLATALRAAGIGTPHSLNRLSVAAASAALADQDHVAKVRDETLRQRTRIVAALDKASVQHSDSRANFVFLRIGQRAARVRGDLAAAGIVIGAPFPPLTGWLRISVGTASETDRLLNALVPLLLAAR